MNNDHASIILYKSPYISKDASTKFTIHLQHVMIPSPFTVHGPHFIDNPHKIVFDASSEQASDHKHCIAFFQFIVTFQKAFRDSGTASNHGVQLRFLGRRY